MWRWRWGLNRDSTGQSQRKLLLAPASPAQRRSGCPGCRCTRFGSRLVECLLTSGLGLTRGKKINFNPGKWWVNATRGGSAVAAASRVAAEVHLACGQRSPFYRALWCMMRCQLAVCGTAPFSIECRAACARLKRRPTPGLPPSPLPPVPLVLSSPEPCPILSPQTRVALGRSSFLPHTTARHSTRLLQTPFIYLRPD